MPARRRSYSRKRFPRRRSGPVRRTYKRRTSTRRVSRTTRSRSACVCPGDLAPATKFALAQLDPFHSNAMGAKVPDSNTQPSVSTTDTEQVTLLSAGLATDLFGMAFRPQYTWGTVTATPGGSLSWGGTYTVNSLNRSKRAAYAAAIELTRPVAHAVRLSSPLAPTAASGFVHIAISTETTFGVGTWQFPTTIAQISGCQFYKRVTLASLTQSPLTIINKWIDDTAFRYSSPTSDLAQGTGANFQSDFAWGAIVMILEGCPIGVNVISAEHLLMSGVSLRKTVRLLAPQQLLPALVHCKLRLICSLVPSRSIRKPSKKVIFSVVSTRLRKVPQNKVTDFTNVLGSLC